MASRNGLIMSGVPSGARTRIVTGKHEYSFAFCEHISGLARHEFDLVNISIEQSKRSESSYGTPILIAIVILVSRAILSIFELASPTEVVTNDFSIVVQRRV